MESFYRRPYECVYGRKEGYHPHIQMAWADKEWPLHGHAIVEAQGVRVIAESDIQALVQLRTILLEQVEAIESSLTELHGALTVAEARSLGEVK